jgi:hypothetical protein
MPLPKGAAMKKPLVILALMGTVSYGAYRMIGSDDAKSEAPVVQDGEQLVLDRIWIDHIPKNDRDTIQVFAAISEEPFGIFQAASSWKGNYELFRYESNGNTLRIVYPQSNDRETVKHNARRCTENQMDFCLELSGGSRGVKRYYSRKGWEIENVSSVSDLHDRADALLSTLEVAK